MTAYCPQCNSKMALRAAVCLSCGYDFPDTVITDDIPQWQFRLKSLFIAVLLIGACTAGVYSFLIEPSRVTKALQNQIDVLGGDMIVTHQFTFISLKGLPIDDNKLSKLIPLMRKCPNLYSIDLSGTLVTDASVAALNTLPESSQTGINLDDTEVSDCGRLKVGGLLIADPELTKEFDRLSESSDPNLHKFINRPYEPSE